LIITFSSQIPTSGGHIKVTPMSTFFFSFSFY